MDVVHRQLAFGKTLRLPTIAAAVPAIMARRSILARRGENVVQTGLPQRGYPQTILVYNRTDANNITLDFPRAGRPTDCGVVD